MKVVVTYKRINAPGWFGMEGKTYFEDGATWIYRGVCALGGTAWFGDPRSAIPQKNWPYRLAVFKAPAAADN